MKKIHKTVSNYPGMCALCGSQVDVGDEISKWGSKWCHTPCCEAQMNTDLINTTNTLKAGKKSTYRRGKSPGSYRSSR